MTCVPTVIPEPINLIVATDKKVTRGAAAAVRSILNHASEPGRLAVTVLDDGLDNVDRAWLRASWRGAGCVRFQDVTALDLSRFPLKGSDKHMTQTTWARIFAPQLFPEIERAIYVDTDVLAVNGGDIAQLWSVDLQGRMIAAVPAIGVPFIAARDGIPDWEALGLNPRDKYFNAGVMVMDFAQMREVGFLEQVIQCAADHPSIRMPGQAVLNIVTAARGGRQAQWLELPRSWNEMDVAFADRGETPGHSSENGPRIRNIARGAQVLVAEAKWLHIVGSPKPWQERWPGPVVREIFHNVESGDPGTAWKGLPLDSEAMGVPARTVAEAAPLVL